TPGWLSREPPPPAHCRSVCGSLPRRFAFQLRRGTCAQASPDGNSGGCGQCLHPGCWRISLWCARCGIRCVQSRDPCIWQSEEWRTVLSSVIPPFLPYDVVTQYIGKFYDFLISDALPLQLGGKIGN